MAKEVLKQTPPQTIEEALALIAGLSEKNKAQEDTIKEQATLIDQLGEQIEKLEGKVARGSSAPTVVVNKKTYAVMASVKHKGETFSPVAVASNEALCKELLAIEGQTILIEEE